MGITAALIGAGAKALGGLGNTVVNGIKVVKGDKAAREKYAAQQFTGALDLAATEFKTAGDTWFDTLINGISRLPRPIIQFSGIAYFYWVAYNSTSVQNFGENLTAMPAWFTFMASSVILFPFGTRGLEKHFVQTFKEKRVAKRAQAHEANAVDEDGEYIENAPAEELSNLEKFQRNRPPKD